MKALQIMLLCAAVLCAVGIAAGFGQKEGTMPTEFNPPGWLRALRGLAGGAELTRRELTRSGRSFPAELSLAAGESVNFKVAAAADDDVRRAEFVVRGDVHIRYRPVTGQMLGGEPVRVQEWPSEEGREAKPAFVIYDRGGTLRIRNRGRSRARVDLGDG